MLDAIQVRAWRLQCVQIAAVGVFIVRDAALERRCGAYGEMLAGLCGAVSVRTVPQLVRLLRCQVREDGDGMRVVKARL